MSYSSKTNNFHAEASHLSANAKANSSKVTDNLAKIYLHEI